MGNPISEYDRTISTLQNGIKEVKDVVDAINKHNFFALVKEVPEAVAAIGDVVNELSKRVGDIERAIADLRKLYEAATTNPR